MAATIVMPLLENSPDYQCHCVKRCEAGPALALCFARDRTNKIRRELAWAEAAEERARTAYRISVRKETENEIIGVHCMGVSDDEDRHLLLGFVESYDPDDDVYYLDTAKGRATVQGETLEKLS